MNKISIFIVTVVMAVTAVLGVLTRNKIDGLQRSLGVVKSEAAISQKSAQDSKSALAKTTADLQAANKVAEERSTQLASLTTERDEAVKKGEEQANLAKAHEGKLAEFAEVEAKLKKFVGQQLKLDELGEKLESLSAERDKLTADLTKANEERDVLSKRVAALEGEVATTGGKLKHYEQNVARLGVTGKVLAVNSNWNFVILDIGDKDGAAPNASLVVSRNGQNIARAKITTVEPGRSVANIIPTSVPRGQSVQPGDQVVFTRL